MNKLIFIDSDILFSFFAINKDKKKKYLKTGTTGNTKLDLIMNMIEKIEETKEIICKQKSLEKNQ